MKSIKTISILGAGWLGMPLGEKLVEAGYTVNGSTTRTERMTTISQKGMKAFSLKIGSEIAGPNLDQFFNCDLLFVNIPPGRRDPKVLKNYPYKIKLILDQIRIHQIPYCIFVSSTSVYGNTNSLATEESPTQPSSDSGKALVICEHLLLNEGNCQTTVLRLAGLAGEDRKVGRFLAGKKELTNGLGKVNLVHLEDCIGVIKAVLQQNQWQEIFNVSADLHPTRQVLYRAQAKKLGLEPPSFKKDSPAKYKLVSNKKVKQVLDYSFQWSDPMEF